MRKSTDHPGKLRVLHQGDDEEMATLGVQKLQLSECLDKMSSEITNLRNTIVCKDKQKENLQRALEDGAVLEKSMHDELEHQHHRAEELEAEVERLQKILQTKSAEDYAGDVSSTVEMQNLRQALHDHRAQLTEKTNQIDSYKQVLRNTAEKLEGSMSDESSEKLTNAFEIAGSLRKLLQDRDKQFASLENTCQSREMELTEAQRKLEATNNTLNVTVGSRDARIRELEKMLHAKEREVQDAHHKLQNVELAIDANDSRAKKLEFDLKLMSNMLWLEAERGIRKKDLEAVAKPQNGEIPRVGIPPISGILPRLYNITHSKQWEHESRGAPKNKRSATNQPTNHTSKHTSQKQQEN